MKPTEIKKGIYWVGVVDWNLRDFHGYSRANGTTYNSYLVVDDKITLFDTVSAGYEKEFMCRVSQVVDPEKIDYIVVNHVEPDHSGALPYVVEKTNPERILCSKMGEKFIHGHFHPENWPIEPVADEQVISLGKRTVQFLETKMLHWPDSMVSYIPEEKLLISQDAFGQNIASSERFDDNIEWSDLKRFMAHYYANIILPFSAKVKPAVQKIQDLGWEIDMIAPDHGLILRKHVGHTINAYLEFAEQKPLEKAVIAYDTMWKSTETMAKVLADRLAAEGLEVHLFHMKKSHHSDVMGELWNAGAFVVGSPTHNNGVMPVIADLLTYVKGLKPLNKVGAAFGSFGWSGESPKLIAQALADMGMETAADPVRVKQVPTHDDYKTLHDLAKNIADKVKDKVGSLS